MQILLDARKLGDGGIGVYLQNLVDGLLTLRQTDEADFKLTLLVDPLRTPPVDWRGEVASIEERAGKYSMAEYLLLARRQRKLLASGPLYHSPHFTLPFDLRCRTVVTIHDCIHLTHPSGLISSLVARPLIGSALRRAGRVITVSEFSRDELRREFPGVREQIDVVPNGCQAVYRERLDERRIAEARLKLGVSAPYCLFVGNDKPHKGSAELFEGWRWLLQELGEACPQLVVVGDGFDEHATRLGERRVRVLNDVEVGELRALTQGAVASLLPSRIEGFGLPALEALAVGTPVVCAPAPALREVCESGAWYAGDFSGRAFAETVLRVIRDPHGAALKADRGRQRSLRYSVDRMARETWAIYADLMGIAPTSRSRREGVQ